MSTKQETRHRIGIRVRDLRTKAGMTREELATRCGLRSSHIGRIEDGVFGSQIDTIQAIAETFGMKLDIV